MKKPDNVKKSETVEGEEEGSGDEYNRIATEKVCVNLFSI